MASDNEAILLKDEEEEQVKPIIFVSKKQNIAFRFIKRTIDILAGIVGIIIKVAIIFASFNILNLFGIFPEKLVSTLQTNMGAVQAITATIGVVIAFVIYELEKRKNKETA